MKIIKKFLKKIIISINILIFKTKKIKIGKNNSIFWKFFVRNKGTFIIGDNCTFIGGIKQNPVGIHHQLIFDVRDNGILKIGNRVGISNCIIVCNNKIEIEDDVMIGSSVQIYDSNHHSINYEKRISKHDDDIKTKPVLLKKGCFIGADSIILKGVTIGEKSVVGAGSVVTKSVPDGEVWGGNPAVFLKKVD